ncbi:hypothetical protein [Bifidobacterium crudilactis]|jgi:hypothetical protein|uniref:hypothetical protein n=1 Tax=Bifidobacterium crudilactis TaxID=327277 RepID=UPI0023543A5A|nr:hypothetical protein [Bifidobacterium crudilactis]MCI2157420.1 hypothetical protein [Bifidobacterium crudilactis]
MNTLEDMTVDVTAERAFARHLAYRLLDDMAAALLDGRTGSVAIPRLDPEFAAITGRSLQLIADTIKTPAPTRFVGKKTAPTLPTSRLQPTKDQNE